MIDQLIYVAVNIPIWVYVLSILIFLGIEMSKRLRNKKWFLFPLMFLIIPFPYEGCFDDCWIETIPFVALGPIGWLHPYNILLLLLLAVEFLIIERVVVLIYQKVRKKS